MYGTKPIKKHLLESGRNDAKDLTYRPHLQVVQCRV